jgi:two-component system CheB/CheR fusion protein
MNSMPMSTWPEEGNVAVPASQGTGGHGAPAAPDTSDETRLLAVVVELVRQSTQVDVSHYKDSTFRRQLQRRLQELGEPDLAHYVDRLARDPLELQRLQQSLLISVTRFFRDAEVFERLRIVLAERAACLQPDEGLRIWVPGCATGEEAYSIAVLVAEALGPKLATTSVRLFATDIDQHAIAQARRGVYPQAALADVPPELAERYFVEEDMGVRPIKAVRDLCVFAHHDLLSQPPFVHLDLISCRNVLIYFQGDVQSEILAKFHHALRPQGWLLLGQSESVGSREGIYEVIPDKHLKLFQRKDVASPRLHEFAPQHRPMVITSTATRQQAAPELGVEARFHAHLLKQHAPASVLVDLQGRVLHLWGNLDRFLRLEGGKADFTLMGLCVPPLRGEVKALVHLAAASPGDVCDTVCDGVELAREEPPVRVRLSAQALLALRKDSAPTPTHGDVQGVVVTFDEIDPLAPEGAMEGLVPVDTERQRLREELATAREHLHTLVQEIEQAQHDQQSLHEELQASSEELQSSNEELQASNEELTTLNEQLIGKSEELSGLNEVLLSIERSMQMAMVVVDEQMRVLRFNPLAVRIFGLLAHDVGRHLQSVPCSLPLEGLPGQVARVLASGEAEVSRVDQAERHYVMQISPLHDARSRLAGVILTFTDVADLRVAEAERSRLAAIVTSSEDAIVGKTLDGIITSWNPGAERLFGYTAEEAIGQPMLMVFPPEGKSEEARLLSAVARGETVATFDTVRIRKDGASVDVSVALSPIRDGSGRIVGVSKIARDITERRQIEAERLAHQQGLEALVVQRTRDLADKERHLQSILDGVPGMVAYWDAGLRMGFANRQHRQILRHEHEGQVGMHISEVLSAEQMARAQPYIDAVLRGEACNFESGEGVASSVGDGKRFQIYFTPDVAEGKVRGFIVMAFDVTTIKRAEAAAAAASQAKSEFLANMSHEIRTPLNAVLGLAQLAQREHGDQPVAQTFHHIVQAGQHLLGVINDVLDFSKIEAGKLELQIDRVDMAQLAEQALSMVADLARSKGLALQVSRDQALASAYAGDPVRLAQLLINLVTNAVKFTDAGEVRLLMHVEGEGVAMVVSDTGAGMSASLMQRLFNPFEQGDGSTTRRVGGTGLGLSICKRLVDLMGGRIGVSSTPGMGSRFEVWLPLRPLQTRQLDAAEPSRAMPLPMGLSAGVSSLPAGAPRLQGLRVLVAEDHPVNQMVLEQLLDAEGAEVFMVAHGGLTVEAVRSHTPDHFDLVLCDIEMPVMDGYEATRQICLLAPELPVIGLTAHAFEDARRKGQACGMCGYVTKPYMIDALVLEMRRHVRPERLQAMPGSPQAPALLIQLDPQALAAHYGTLPGFLPRLMAAVRQTCVGQPAQLSEALALRQGGRLRYLAHGVAGMAANLLMPELRALAHRLEHVAEHDLVEAATLVAQLNQALHSLCVALDTQLADAA